MVENLKSLFVSFVLIGVVIFAIIGFAVQFQVDMDANDTILNESTGNINETYGWMAENLSETSTTAGSQRASFENETATTEFGELTFKSIVGVGKTITGTISGMFNIIGDSIMTAFGLGEENDRGFIVVTSSLSAILIMVLIFLAWRVYKSGS